MKGSSRGQGVQPMTHHSLILTVQRAGKKDSLEESECVRDGKASTSCWLISWQY